MRTCLSLGHTTIDPPPVNHLATHPASIALVPGGALSTAGRAMLGSALQPLGWMPCVSKCGSSVNFRAKPLLNRPTPSLFHSFPSPYTVSLALPSVCNRPLLL